MGSEENFVLQQGFTDDSALSCVSRYPGLMWQPRVIGVLVLIGLVLQSGHFFLVLSALLWWSALLPRLNPFEAVYNFLVARPKGLPPLNAAPPPRRFSQGLAGTFMLAIGLSLLFGHDRLAWILEALLVVALGLLIFVRLCVGSYLFLLLTGQAAMANRTLPWSRAPRS
jgi:hypothetical protein